MGYYTTFSLSLVNGPKEQFDCLIKDLSEFLKDKNFLETQSFYGKWYDYKKDIKAFSLKYPDITFLLEGDGEDFNDLWQEYWCAGDSVHEDMEFSSYEEIKGHMSLGISFAIRAEDCLLREIRNILRNNAMLNTKNGPVKAYIIQNANSPSDRCVKEMEVKYFKSSENSVQVFLSSPTAKGCTREEALNLTEKESEFGTWYELNSENFSDMLLPTLCNIRKALKV